MQAVQSKLQTAETQPGECDVVLVGYETQENLGLRSIAAFLLQHGIRVAIEPCHKATKEEILAHIQREKPKIVGFSLIFQRMLFNFADLISYLRAQGITAHFTMGGHFATLEYKLVLELIPGLDTVVRHEGEETLLELFQKLAELDTWAEIKGIAFRRNGEIVATPARPLIPNLDTLPYAIRDTQINRHRGLGICSITSSRGCYYNCSFCSIQEFYREAPGPKRRSRSPAYVAQEVEKLYYELDARIFIFQDDDLYMKGGRHKQWVNDFIHELTLRNLADKILWRVSCRIDDLDAEMLVKMKGFGLASVYLGIESGSEEGLKTFNKHYTVKDVYNTVDMLNQIDMPFEFGFMILEPYSTMATVRDNINFLKYVTHNTGSLVNFCKMAPYAGTPIARKLQVEGRLEGTPDSPDYKFNDPRLDLLQLFFSQTFNFRNFSDHGLVERLRFAKFDCSVLSKFFPGMYDVQAYAAALRDLIQQNNVSALETMSLATNFMDKYSEEQIIDHWQLLERWGQAEIAAQFRTEAMLSQLQSQYDLS